MKNEKKKILLELDLLTETERLILLKQLIQTKSDHQKYDSTTKYVKRGTLLMILSGLIVFTDNILSLIFPGIDNISIPHFKYFTAFIYSLCLSISPFMIIRGFKMNAYKYSILSPIIANTVMILAALVNAIGYKISGDLQFTVFTIIFILLIIRYYKKFQSHMDYIRIIERAKTEYIKADMNY